MIIFDCLSQSGENDDQQKQQEGSWTDFVERILSRLKNPKTLAGSGVDRTSFPLRIKDELNQDN
jgi:hypothetical protein